jgi:hypothetical protein
LPEVTLALVPDVNGVDLLARQIKMTGRAYPLFQIALMILEKPERHAATFTVKKNAEGQPVQPLFGCALDESLWLSEDEVVKHILSQHLATFYQAERTQTDPPKGKYTFVAQCGMSGVILGPPNHHDYQKKLQELHAQRFPRLPFDAFKARVKIVKDEAVVAKWIEDQSWKTEYICLNIPDAPKLGSMEDVENHFRAVHAPNIVKAVETITISGKTCRNLRCPGLARLYRIAVEDQRRFPLQIATVLSQQFAQHGRACQMHAPRSRGGPRADACCGDPRARSGSIRRRCGPRGSAVRQARAGSGTHAGTDGGGVRFALAHSPGARH